MNIKTPVTSEQPETTPSIINLIKKDQLEARKFHQSEKATWLTTLISEISIVAKNEQREVTDEDSLKVLRKFVKNINDTIKLIGKDAPNNVRYESLAKELDLYNNYLPQMLDTFQTVNIVENIVMNLFNQNNTKPNFGMVMKMIKDHKDSELINMKHIKGMFDVIISDMDTANSMS